MPELQEMMGHAVNNLVKHFYKPEKEVSFAETVVVLKCEQPFR